MRVIETAVGHWPAELPGDWPPTQGQSEPSLMIGQGMVVTSRRHCDAPGLL